MDFIAAGLLCIAVLLFLIGIGLQIGLSFILSGFISSYLLLGFDRSVSMLGQAAYYSVASPTWVAIPLFILMGSFASNGNLAKMAYDSLAMLTRRIHGSLMIATCFSCGVFGAVSGSSIATTAIFGKMALPEMLEKNYNKSLSVGCIASAGTFASMIPPSMMLIIYALFTQQSIGKLFAAGLLPGIVTALSYAVLIYFMVRRNPALAPSLSFVKDRAVSKRKAAVGVLPILAISFVVLGGLYSGVFTPTEAAAAGALVTLITGYFLKQYTANKIIGSFRESASVTAMLFLVNIGALFYSRILALTGLPTEVAVTLTGLNMSPVFVLLGVMLLMFFLGMIMVPIAIYALTLPIVMPVLLELGYDPIWFGIIALKLTEIGAITPPVGLNVFAIKGVIPKKYNVSMSEVYKGCMPFLAVDVVLLGFFVAFPGLVLWLPNIIWQ